MEGPRSSPKCTAVQTNCPDGLDSDIEEVVEYIKDPSNKCKWVVDQGSAYCELFSEFPIRARQHYKSDGWTWIARFPSKTRRGGGCLNKGYLGTTNMARKNVGFIMHVLECLASPNNRSLRQTKGITQHPSANRAVAARNALAQHLTGLTSRKGMYSPQN